MKQTLHKLGESLLWLVKDLASIRSTITRCVDLPCSPIELFSYLEDVENWIAFSFHNILQVQQCYGHWKVDTLLGPGTLSLTKNVQYGILDHRLTLVHEDALKFFMRIVPHAAGCQLILTTTKPDGMTTSQFESLVNYLDAQLTNLKTLLN